MPNQPILPIWGGLNTANSPSATGLVDPVTGQQYNTGGLEVGDYFDLTEKQANSLSNTVTGLCHWGRYRYVLVDSGATVADVTTGTVGYMRAGSFVQNVVITNAGTGQTTGVYTIAATLGSGGGSGASIQVVVGSGGTITSATVLNGGFGYISIPTFSLTAIGGSAGVVAAQLNASPNTVTSADKPSPIGGRAVVFLNAITPGNYGFVQESGLATVLASGAIINGNYVNATSNGTVQTGTTTYALATIGIAQDTGTSGNTLKTLLTLPMIQD